MRKIVRNLVIRAVAAAVVAVITDLAAAKRPVAKKAAPAAEPVHEAEAWVRSVTHRAARWAHDADVSDHVRDACHRILTSGVADRSEATIARLLDVGSTKLRGALRRR